MTTPERYAGDERASSEGSAGGEPRGRWRKHEPCAPALIRPMSLADALLLAHLAATLFMVGVIWFVQVVHYPLLGGVGPAAFVAYAREHARRTGWVVGPPMLVEAATVALLLVRRPAEVPGTWVWVGLALLVPIWFSTVRLPVPRHRLLATGFDAEAARTLILTNWIRTVAWTLRAVLALAMVARAMG